MGAVLLPNKYSAVLLLLLDYFVFLTVWTGTFT